MVKKRMFKICIRVESEYTDKEVEQLCDDLSKRNSRVMLQKIDNNLHAKWLANQNNMKWKYVIDVASNDLSNLTQDMENRNVDIYEVKEITYKEPVENAELITSCYLMNSEVPEEMRNKSMLEHFEMEKKQTLYDYIAFQIVKDTIYDYSPKFEFFFESHVSTKDGIDQIYSKSFLNGMREHSRLFLNADTRQLSFGKVKTMEEKK